jgi:hypothetical protein
MHPEKVMSKVCRRLAAALVLSCLIAAPAAAQQTPVQPDAAQAAPTLPDTPVGRMTKLYLQASNSGDAERIKAFLAQHFPSASNAEDFIAVRERTQGVEIISIDVATETRLELLVKSRRSGTLLRMILVVDAAAPHNFRTISLMLG